jgi:hypothetical protein
MAENSGEPATEIKPLELATRCRFVVRLGLKLCGVMVGCDAATPNDPKLSDGGAWRGSCVVERRRDIRTTVEGGSE